jgi:hypothetical protein
MAERVSDQAIGKRRGPQRLHCASVCAGAMGIKTKGPNLSVSIGLRSGHLALDLPFTRVRTLRRKFPRKAWLQFDAVREHENG